MTSIIEDNVKVVETFFAALNDHDLNRMDQLRASSFEGGTIAGTMNAERIHRYNETLISGFPDLHLEINLTVAEGDYVVANWTITGTHSGMFRTPSRVAIPPSGRPAAMVGSHIFEIKNGRIVRDWFYTDMVSLLSQLGLMPPM